MTRPWLEVPKDSGPVGDVAFQEPAVDVKLTEDVLSDVAAALAATGAGLGPTTPG